MVQGSVGLKFSKIQFRYPSSTRMWGGGNGLLGLVGWLRFLLRFNVNHSLRNLEAGDILQKLTFKFLKGMDISQWGSNPDLLVAS